MPVDAGLRRAAPERLQVMGDVITVTAEIAGGPVIGDIAVAVGSGVPLHRHASPELFQVLEGEFLLTAVPEEGARQELRAGAGAVIAVPAWRPHGYRNIGEAPGRLLVVFDRAMHAFFREVAAAAPTSADGPPGEAEIRRVLELAARHGIEMLEAPPT